MYGFGFGLPVGILYLLLLGKLGFRIVFDLEREREKERARERDRLIRDVIESLTRRNGDREALVVSDS